MKRDLFLKIEWHRTLHAEYQYYNNPINGINPIKNTIKFARDLFEDSDVFLTSFPSRGGVTINKWSRVLMKFNNNRKSFMHYSYLHVIRFVEELECVSLKSPNKLSDILH